MTGSGSVAVRAWDAPVRLFHWALLLLVCGAVASGLVGGNWMVWHMRCGYAVLALLLFRILWGIFGSSTARFVDFLYGPRRMLEFAGAILRRREAHFLGHNPLGGAMVLVLIAALLFQAVSGLFSNDDISVEGPLYKFIGKDLSDRLTGLHKQNVNVLYALVGLHVAAVLFHWIGRGENLVRTMLTGMKSVPLGTPGTPGRFASPWLALALFALAALAVWIAVAQPFGPSMTNP